MIVLVIVGGYWLGSAYDDESGVSMTEKFGIETQIAIFDGRPNPNNGFDFLNTLSKQEILDMYMLISREVILNDKKYDESDLIVKMLTWIYLDWDKNADSSSINWNIDYFEYGHINFAMLFGLNPDLTGNSDKDYKRVFDLIDNFSEREQLTIMISIMKKNIDEFKIAESEMVLLGYIGEKYPEILDLKSANIGEIMI